MDEARAATFDYVTSATCNTWSYTLELGLAQPFGANDLSHFAGINAGLPLER